MSTTKTSIIERIEHGLRDDRNAHLLDCDSVRCSHRAAWVDSHTGDFLCNSHADDRTLARIHEGRR